MKLAMIFTSHMIIQREMPIKIWGAGETGRKVTVSLDEVSRTVEVTDSQWIVELPPMKVSRGLQMIVSDGEEKVVLNDISIGDVYIAAGQSNMEFHMRYDADFTAEKDVCENKDICFFDYPEVSYHGQLEDFDYSQMGFWRTCDKENLEYYSAVAYYFAKSIQSALNIPIGIIGCNWGGTVAATWADVALLEQKNSVWIMNIKKD